MQCKILKIVFLFNWIWHTNLQMHTRFSDKTYQISFFVLLNNFLFCFFFYSTFSTMRANWYVCKLKKLSHTHPLIWVCFVCVKMKKLKKRKKRLKSSGLLCLNALLSIQSQFVVSWIKTFIKSLLPIINRDVRKYFNTSQFSVWITIHLKYITNIYSNFVPEKINFI